MASGQATRLDALLGEARRRIDAFEAEMLVAHVLDRPRTWLFAHSDAEVPAPAIARLEALIARRERGEPVAYLTGSRGFWSFDLGVTADTLIPRPETELLVETVLDKLPAGEPVSMLDLGTGSGAIALAVALERPKAQVTAVDRSEAALAVAKANGLALGLHSVEFLAGDWYAPLPDGRFDVIASNPPYIAGDDPHLQQGDLRFEPRQALTPEGDGLAAFRTIIAGAPPRLKTSGWLMFEHGFDQGMAIRTLLHDAGFDAIETRVDLEGRERVTLSRWRGESSR